MARESHQEGVARGAAAPAASESQARLEARTTEELYALAAQLGIPGHTEMSRPELIEAIRRR